MLGVGENGRAHTEHVWSLFWHVLHGKRHGIHVLFELREKPAAHE